MRWRALRATEWLGLLAALGGSASAARAAVEPPLPELRTPTVVVVATRPAQRPEDPSAFTTVVETRDFEGEAKSLEQLVERTVGVQVRSFGGPGEPAEISIRGSTGAQVVVLLDGVRLNSAQSGTVDLTTIPLSVVERVEIVRGGGGIQQGSDAVGGVVDITTRRVGSEPESHAIVSGGSFGTYQASVSQSGRIGGVEVLGAYDFFRTDGDYRFPPGDVIIDGEPLPDVSESIPRVNNDSENHSGLISLARDFGEKLRLSFSDSLFYGSAGRPGPAFGPGVVAQQSLTARQRRTRNVASLTLQGASLGALGLDTEAKLFHRFDRSRFRDPSPPLGAPVDSDNRNQSFGSRGRVAKGGWKLGPTRNEASLGLEVRGDFLDSLDFDDPSRAAIGLFFQDDVSLFGGRLHVVPGVRLDYTAGGEGSGVFGDEWLPRLGLVGRPLPWLEFRANAERSYRVPNFDELFFNEGSLRGNPNLVPERAWNFDAGFDLGFERLWLFDDLQLEAVGFHNDIDNSIVFQLVSSNVSAADNTGPARSSGVELAAAISLYWLSVAANYTYLNTALESTGMPLPGRPEHEFDLRMALSTPGELLKIVAERNQISDFTVNFEGSGIVPGRVVWDVSLGLDVARLPGFPALGARNLIFSVAANNVTDQAVRDAQGFPQPGRTLTFRAEGAW